MRFKEWLKLQESGTSTGDVAGFSRISIPLVRRVWGSNAVEDMYPDKDKKKKKLYELPQVKS